MKNDKKPIVFKTIISQAIEIDFEKGNSFKLFNESNKNDESITNFTEQETVKWIFKQQMITNKILEEICGLRLDEVIIKTEIKEPLLNKERQKIIGDIDTIIIPKLNPEKSIIIEFKRIKINTDTENKTKINKIKTAKTKGIKQVNKLRTFKFHKTYLGLIIQEDSRNIESPNTIIRNSEIYNMDIYNIDSENKLEKNVGILFINLTQPTGENFKNRNNFGIAIQKKAYGTKQSDINTLLIKSILE